MLTRQSKTLFLILVFIQAFHSLEEYIGRLWLVLEPARILSTLLTDHVEFGFVVIHLAFFILGLWISLFALKKNYPFAKYLVWFWVIVEFINGLLHPILALNHWSYIPGLITAPALLLISISLFKSMRSRTIYCVKSY